MAVANARTSRLTFGFARLSATGSIVGHSRELVHEVSAAASALAALGRSAVLLLLRVAACEIFDEIHCRKTKSAFKHLRANQADLLNGMGEWKEKDE